MPTESNHHFKNWSIQTKIISAFTLVLLLVCGFTFLYFPYRQKQQATLTLQDKAQSMVKMLGFGVGFALSEGNYTLFNDIFSSVKEDPNILYIAVLDETGTQQIAFNPTDISIPTQVYTAPTTFEKDKLLHAAVPLNLHENNIGSLMMGISLKARDREIVQIRITGIGLGFGVFILGILASIFVSRRITNPLGKLADTIQHIHTNKTYGQTLPKESNDEVGILIDAFNTMSLQIRKNHNELEARVNDRTLDLNLANTKLRSEISERKEAEKSLRLSEERFRLLSDSASEGILIQNRGVIVDVNSVLARMLGYEKPADVIGKRGWQFIAPESRAHFKDMIRSQTTLPFEGLILRHDGTTCPVEVIGRSFMNEQMGVAAIRDITERKEAADSKRQLEVQLIQSERMASVGTVAAGIIHNLKNPLTGILGFSELLQFKHPEISESDKIVDAARQMSDMIENILTKSRQKRDVEAIDLNALLIRELEFMQADSFFKTHTEVEHHLSPDLPTFMGTYSDFSQIFGNLLRNATEALYDREIKKIRIETLHGESGIRVAISDTGCGISEENQHNLFQPFFSTKTKEDGPKGTGLGLYTVSELLGTYGATIQVDTEENVGTTFWITIPIKGNVPSSTAL